MVARYPILTLVSFPSQSLEVVNLSVMSRSPRIQWHAPSVRLPKAPVLQSLGPAVRMGPKCRVGPAKALYADVTDIAGTGIVPVILGSTDA